MAKNLQNKLIRIDRIINVYRKNLENSVREVEVEIDLKILLTIIEARPGDPDLYDGYVLKPDQLFEINKSLKKPIESEFATYIYVLEAVGIYN